jgi:hypothetical protein
MNKPTVYNKLWKACRVGNLEKVKELLSNGVNYGIEDSLRCACFHRHQKCVKLLLEYGADLFLIEDEYDKIKCLYYIITNNLATEDYLKKNFDKIPSCVWDKVYEVGSGWEDVTAEFYSF